MKMRAAPWSAVAAPLAFRVRFMRQMSKGKAVAAATALQGAFGTVIFITAGGEAAGVASPKRCLIWTGLFANRPYWPSGVRCELLAVGSRLSAPQLSLTFTGWEPRFSSWRVAWA